MTMGMKSLASLSDVTLRTFIILILMMKSVPASIIFRFPNTDNVTALHIDMSKEINHIGVIQNPEKNSTLAVDSFIIFKFPRRNLVWLSIQNSSEHSCQTLPISITSLAGRQVAFHSGACNTSSEAIFSKHIYEGSFIQFQIDARSYIPEFNLSYQVKANLLCLSNTSFTQGVAVPSSGYIMSHESFNFGVDIPAAALEKPPDSASYYGGTTYRLLITLPIATTHIKINFIHLKIGTRNLMSCDNIPPQQPDDRLIISNGHEQLFDCAGGSSPPADRKTFEITSMNNTLLFELRTNGETPRQLLGFSGFLLQYEISFCTSEYPNAKIVRSTNFPVFTVYCSDNATTTHEITCSDGRWTGSFLPEMCPNVAGEPSQINTTISTVQYSETTPRKTLTTSAATTHKEKYTYTTTTNRTQQSEFRWEMIHTVSVAAGGGGLILVTIIIALAVVICRRNHSGSGSATEEKSLRNGMIHNERESEDNVYHCLEEGDPAHAAAETGIRDSDGDGYSMVDLTENRNDSMANSASKAENQITTTPQIDPSDGGPYLSVNLLSKHEKPSTTNNPNINEEISPNSSVNNQEESNNKETAKDVDKEDKDDEEEETYANLSTITRQGTEKQKIKEDLYGSILAETKKKPVQQAQPMQCTAENEAEDMIENDLYGT